MDISALSESKFKAAEWINSNYKQYVEDKEKSEPVSKEIKNQVALEFINTYVAKLQMYVQQINYAVEDTSQQLIASMPRIAQDAHLLQTDVHNLQERMHNVRKEVDAVRMETGDCMAALERINNLQSKVLHTKETLQESDGWGNLITELEDSFERNDLSCVCEKLLALQKSLHAQQQLPGHAERQTQTEDFKNRLEALATPQLVQYFAAGDVINSKKYYNIFMGIERLTQLQQYYRAVQKNNLQQKWKQLLEQQQQTMHFLKLYYEELLEVCQRQVSWCMQVFEDQQQPFIVLAEILPALEPTRESTILQLLKNSNEHLIHLEQFATANQKFARQLKTLLLKLNLELSPELQQQLVQAIYEYFYKFIQQYARLEETHLNTFIDNLFASKQGLGEAVRHLHNSNNKIFECISEACERCNLISNNLALCQLITVLGGTFKRLLENYVKTQRQLRLNSNIDEGQGHTEQWSLLQYSMLLLEYLTDFQQRLQQFELLLVQRISTLNNNLKNPTSDEFNIYQTLERPELERLLTSIAKYELEKSQHSIFESTHESLFSQYGEIHEIALNILLQPVETYFMQLSQMQDVEHFDADLPSFSLAPQEYITQIGQYLLTLPQHLEPLLLSPSALLKQALEQCHDKYTHLTPCADIMLALVVEQCCALFCTQMLQIKSLSAYAAKQLVVDILYLSNVTEELGGLKISSHLSQILTLLQAPPEQYLALSSGCEPRLVTIIRQMRNIISTQ